MISPVMNCERVEEIVPKVVDGEAQEWEVTAVEDHTATCVACAQLRADLIEIGAFVREPVKRAVAQADFSRFWQNVSRGIDALPAPARTREAASPWILLSRLAAVAGVAAAAVFAFVMHPVDHRDHYEEFDQKVSVERIEGGVNNTIMIYESPDQDVTFIWVVDPVEEKQPS